MAGTTRKICVTLAVVAVATGLVVIGQIFCPLPYALVAGWSSDRALADARRNSATLQRFEAMFPGGQTYFSRYTGQNGRTVLNSIGGVKDRFVVTMQVPVTVNRFLGSIISFDTPMFLVQEVGEIQELSDGRVSITYKTGWTISPADWKEVETANGDLGVVGIPVGTSTPLAGFHRAVH